MKPLMGLISITYKGLSAILSIRPEAQRSQDLSGTYEATDNPRKYHLWPIGRGHC